MAGSFRSDLRRGLSPRCVILTILVGMVMSLGDFAQGQPSPVAAPDKADISPRGQRTANDITFGGWRKLCFKAAGSKSVCRTSITGKFDTGQIAVRVDLIEGEGGQARLQLFLPVGMYLQAGVKLSVDKASPYPVPYTWCLTNGCIAAEVAAPTLIEEMTSGQTLTLEIVDTNILSLTTAVPLAQFASVHKSAPEKIYEQDIDE